VPPAIHSTAVILASGDEILTGQLLDTNTRWIAEQLVSRGIMPIAHAASPDDLPSLVEMIRRACSAAPLVILTGGLGPTEGDLTRQAIAQVLNEPLIEDAKAAESIRTYFEKRGRATSERQLRQAQRPARATCLPNTNGTAPGLHAQVQNPKSEISNLKSPCDFFALPGPPGELRPMFEREVLPRLRPDPSRTVITRLLHIIGLPEADCVDRLRGLTSRGRAETDALVGITASGGVLTLRIRYSGPGPRAATEQAINTAESAAREALGDHLLPLSAHQHDTGQEALARHLLTTLAESNPPATLATVESCTGGMLGELLTAIPGSSAAYCGGFITYANAMKESLGVDPELTKVHGAVSAEVAKAMARAGIERTGARYSLAITGIAGPDGGTAAKPVGTVHIALTGAGEPATSRRFLFTGDREDVRRRATTTALTMLHFHQKGHAAGTPRLLWETT
jgi:nicotinamide-nucleotide amidase